jgi:nitrite reductase/ring-hydroxylating ferredoxin subunit
MSPNEDDARGASGRSRVEVCLGSSADMSEGARLDVLIGNRSIAVFNVQGTYYAIHGRCPHQRAPLSRGKLQGTVVCSEETDWDTRWVDEGEVLVCPGHAMEFNLRTGMAYGYGFRLRTYPVEERDGFLWLSV